MAGARGTFCLLTACVLVLAGCAGPALVAREAGVGQAAGLARRSEVGSGIAGELAEAAAPSPPRDRSMHAPGSGNATHASVTSVPAHVPASSRSLAEAISAAELAPDVKARLLAALSPKAPTDSANITSSPAEDQRATPDVQGHSGPQGDSGPQGQSWIHGPAAPAGHERAQAMDASAGTNGPPTAGGTTASSPLAARAVELQTPHVVSAAFVAGDEPANDGSAGTSSREKPDWQQALSGTLTQLEQVLGSETASSDTSLALRLRLLYLAAGRREDALRPIASLAPAEQDFWNNEFYALAELINPRTDAAQRAAVALPHHRYAALALAEMAPLRVQNLAFCREVASYGMYTRYPQDRFQPGEEVLLYAELENFQSRSTPRGWHTSFRARYQILDASGKRVAHGDLPRTEEYCAHPRRDYFVCYFVTIPSRLYDGQYTLELAVEDALGNELATATIDFAVVDKAERP
jgi:hypothetical protein